MRRYYGLLSFIFGLISLNFLLFLPSPFLAVLFAVLFKARGDRDNKKQRIFARVGFILGCAMFSVFTLAFWGEIMIFEKGPMSYILPFGLAIAVAALSIWLYKRKWKSHKQGWDHVITE